MIDMVGSAQQRKFGQDKLDTLTQYCLDCDVRFACNGGCPKDRFATSPYGEAGQHYLCPSYKAFFHHVDAGDGADARPAPSQPGAERRDGALRGRGRPSWPKRPVHVRQRPQVEGLPRA